MRITVGVKSLKEAEYFLRNGADEIYFGAMVPNHRGTHSSEKEIADSIKLAKRLKKRTLLALNQIYPREKYGFLLSQARRLTDAGLTGVVVRDPSLLEYFAAKKFSTYFVAGINCACFNSQTVEFYRNLGVKRFTLNSQIMPEDARKMFANSPKTEIGIFVPCLFLEHNIVPFCFFGYPGTIGSPTKLACVIDYKCGCHDFRMLNSNLYFQADLLYDFHKLGVGWLKVSRQRNTPKLIAEFRIALFLHRLLEQGVDRKSFAAATAELITRVDMNKYGHSYTFKPFPDK